MNNYFIIHGSFGNPFVNWFPYLRKERIRSHFTKIKIKLSTIFRQNNIIINSNYRINSVKINIKKFYQFRETPNLIARTNHSTVHKVFSSMYVSFLIFWPTLQ